MSTSVRAPSDSGSSAETEWERAQQLQISVDLIPLAKEELKFLAIVNATPALKNPQALERAINRYLNCWLPLANKWEDGAPLVPPLDCAWIWHCHKLNPVQYWKDCMQLFGKLVDVVITEPSQASDVEVVSIAEWSNMYPSEPYHLIRAGEARIQGQSINPPKNQNLLEYDLVAAAERQSSFYFQVCRPWMSDDNFLHVALGRYRGFLHLVRRALESQSANGPRPFIVPTYDIDLLWHSHQLCATAYRADTNKCVGQILDHDDSNSNRGASGKLRNSFIDTCEKWLATFGTVYEHAGSLYWGPEPTRLAPPVPAKLDGVNQLEMVRNYPADHIQGNSNLYTRATLQVNLVILRARNICSDPKAGVKTYFYVRVTALKKCPGLALTTSAVQISSTTNPEVEWNEGFSLEAEVSTEGLCMELLSYYTNECEDAGNEGCFWQGLMRKVSGFRRKQPKLIGKVSIDWEKDLHSSSGLSLTKWVSVVPQISEDRYSPQIHFSISITPPIPAPFIFRRLQAPVADDWGSEISNSQPSNGRSLERWITRTYVDHAGQEQFVTRTRWFTGVERRKSSSDTRTDADTIINVHQRAFRSLDPSKPGDVKCESLVNFPRASPIVGSAKKLIAPGENLRLWSLFDNGSTLKVKGPERYPAPLDCQLEGHLGYPLRLLSGRWLDYDVHQCWADLAIHGRDESKYLTLVRYTPDSPMGKATALINWQDGAVEVRPEESVVLVLLISTSISISLLDMGYVYPAGKKGKTSRSDGHLGAVLIRRDGLSLLWKRKSSD